MPEDFLFENNGPVTTITFNRPERRNCMNRQVMTELEDLLRDVRNNRDTRILIVTGTGTAFSAGADMTAAKGISDPKERMRAFATHNGGVARMVGRTFDQVTRLDCMTIAAVNGHAVGGGWALAAAFDFIIAAEQAGRDCCGLELSERYASVIVRRWAAMTNGAPVCHRGDRILSLAEAGALL